MTTRTLTLADFLLARIAEDEENANRLHDLECDVPLANTPVMVFVALQGCDCGVPARVIAECEAKRRIVAGTWGRADDQPGVGEGMSRAFDFAAKMLAQPYADHPDFRQEWRA